MVEMRREQPKSADSDEDATQHHTSLSSDDLKKPSVVVKENDEFKTRVLQVPAKSPADDAQISTNACNGLSVGVQIDERLVEVAREKHLQGRLVFMISLITIVLLSLGVTSLQWLLPYYYTLFAPILLLIRLVQYWSLKWQFYLLDFCYFANAGVLLYIWAFPSNSLMFTVLFAFSHGPIACAVIMFRNSAVFHSADKMTSIFIHLLPPLVLYCIRWYPERTSQYWYTSFTCDVDVDVASLFTWMVAVPFGCFVLHTLLYAVLVYGVLKPGKEYDTSFKYISSKSGLKVIFECLGTEHAVLIYHLMNFVYCLVALLVTPLWFSFFPAHAAFLAAGTCATFWNGAGYYLDVFRKKPAGMEARSKS